MAAADVFRVYTEVGKDGYPPEWHRLPSAHGTWPGIKHLVREQAEHRCVRCEHPYRSGAHGNGEWSACDERCSHHDDAPLRVMLNGELAGHYQAYNGGLDIARAGWDEIPAATIEAQWRILTVHHLNGDKADCRWWNLAALCQRCHLTIQGRVQLHRVWPWEHSDWFKPYAAGWYAHAYLGEDLTREETFARLDELLALERSV